MKSRSRLVHSTLEFILTHPFLILLVIGLLTAPAVWVLASAKFSPSIVESFVDDPREYEKASALEDLFPGNPDSLVWVATTEPQLFSYATLNAIRDCAAEIQDLPAVRRVIALPNLNQPAALAAGLRGTAAKIVLNAKLKDGQVPETRPVRRPILPFRSKPEDEALRRLGEQLLESESQVAQVLSSDGKSQVMLVELADQVMQPGDQISLVQDIERIVQEHGLGEEGFYCSGLIPLQAYGFEEMGSVLQTLLPLGVLLIGISVFWIFHRIEVILITLLIAAISIAWGVSLGILLFGKISVLLVAVPLMVLVISTADVIHLISSYNAEANAGVAHETAIHKTFSEVGGACVLTSITTFVGFLSLVFVPANTIRQFGFSAAAGVASALLLSVVLVPIFLDQLHRWGRSINAFASASKLTQRVAMHCLHLGTQRPKTTVVAFLALLVLCGYFAKDLRLDPDLTRRFRASHPSTDSTQFFQEHFGGINSVELLLHAPADKLLTPEMMTKLRRFADRCTKQLECQSVQSVDDLFRLFLTQIDYKNEEGVPESTTHAVATLEYLRKLDPELVDSLVTPDQEYLRILVRISATSYLEMTRITEQLMSEAQREFGEDIEIVEKGSAPVVGRAVREIIRGHMQGFVFCFTTIFLLIALGLRSFSMAFLSVLPNLTPLLLLGGMVALTLEIADSDLLAVGTLGLGLAVDDTIHFLSRLGIERRSGKSLADALETSMNHTGLAIIRTTLILTIGFIPFAFSTYLSINMLGTYLIVVLLAAVLADLIFLPAIIQLVLGGKRKKPVQKSH